MNTDKDLPTEKIRFICTERYLEPEFYISEAVLTDSSIILRHRKKVSEEVFMAQLFKGYENDR